MIWLRKGIFLTFGKIKIVLDRKTVIKYKSTFQIRGLRIIFRTFIKLTFMSFSRFFFTTINTFTSNDNRSPLSRGFSFICSPVYYFKSSENLYLLLRNCNASRNICRGIDPSSLVVNVSVLEVSDTNPEVPLNPLDFFYFGGGSIF